MAFCILALAVRLLIPLDPAAQLKRSLSQKDPVLKKDSVLVFTCGALDSNDNPSVRQVFLEYARKNIAGINFFKAEAFFESLVQRDKKDLLSWEKELASFSDCILIIVESPGAQTEFGAFAVVDELAKIVLAVNDQQFKGEPSFITEGPVAKIDNVSKFAPTIHADFEAVLTSVGEIEERLSTIQRSRGVSVKLASFEEFNETRRKIQMLFIADLIALYSPVTHRELIRVLVFLFGNNSYDIHAELALLSSLKIIDRNNGLYSSCFREDRLFFKYDKSFKWKDERSAIIRKYFQDDRSRLPSLGVRMMKEAV